MQQYPEYLLWNRRKTLTGSPDPTRANGMNRPCNICPSLHQVNQEVGGHPGDNCTLTGLHL